jgi:hypothetical protein
MRFRRENRLSEQIGVVRNEKVRGSNPLSSTNGKQGLTCGNTGSAR